MLKYSQSQVKQQNASRQHQRFFDLLVAIVGIYSTYMLAGILHEWMIKIPYVNHWTHQKQVFQSPIGLIVFSTGSSWFFGSVINFFIISPQNSIHIPAKNSIICAFILLISSLTYIYAVYLTSFPLGVLVKSCNVLSVILVGALCSRVSDKKLKLGPKKLIVGSFATIGIIIFKWFDPTTRHQQELASQKIGIFLLFVSLLADGFLPDFQAEIKINYNPSPTQMMQSSNKWTCLLGICYSILIGEQFYTVKFILSHPLFGIHILFMMLLSTIGQMVVYRTIKKFKQHLVPFIITTRKIFTVGLSILYYHHQTNFMQIMGIFITLVVVVYEFSSQLQLCDFSTSIKKQTQFKKLPQCQQHPKQFQQKYQIEGNLIANDKISHSQQKSIIQKT